MALYEYKCKKCGFDFESIIKLNEEPKCPKCNSTNLKKKVSKNSFQLKGSGWAKDGYE